MKNTTTPWRTVSPGGSHESLEIDSRLTRFLMALSLVGLLASAATGTPAKPTVTPDRVGVVQTAEGAQPAIVEPPGCALGAPGPVRFLIDYLQPPDDAYYIRARPSSCAECAGAPGVWISSLTLTLEFRVACIQPFEVAVVGAMGDTACAPPHPERVLLGPVAFPPAVSPIGLNTYTFPFGHSVALLNDAYLRVTFTGDGAGCSTDGTRPRLVTTSSCSLCVAWNYYPADTLDLCAALFPGNPIVYAVVDSCVSAALAGVDERTGAATGVRVVPNPTRAESDIRFTLPSPAHVLVTLHDVAGRRIRDLADGAFTSGEHAVHWDGRDQVGRVARPGTYFVTVRANGRATARRMVFAR